MDLLLLKRIGFLKSKPLSVKPVGVNKLCDRSVVQADKTVLNRLTTDVFERMPSTKTYCIQHKPYGAISERKIHIKINPSHKGVVYRKEVNPLTGKTEKIPTEVYVARPETPESPAFPSFYFIDKNTKQEVGFVTLMDFRHLKNDKSFYAAYKDSPYYEIFPELGIGKDRIAINALQNNQPDKYSGIGELADKVALEYCLKENITPNIVSIADKNSHAAHYKRGRRFFNIDKNDVNIDGYEFLKQFKTLNPNEIIEARIKGTAAGDKVYTEDLGQLFMYMPQTVVEKYLKLISENPIFK